MRRSTKVVKSSAGSLEMTASEKISKYVKENVTACGEDTSSVKFCNRLLKGSRMDDSHLEFVMRLLGKLRNENNGSFSINCPSNLDEERTQMLSEAVKNVHGQMEHVLETVFQMLPESEQAVRFKIQEQNLIRRYMLGKIENASNAAERVDNYLLKNDLLVIPECSQLEMRIVGGRMVFEEPNGAFWRQGPDTAVAGETRETWVTNYDLFGRTRVPLANDEAAEYALTSVFNLAKSFEDWWRDKDVTSTEMIVEEFYNWSETLEFKDTEVQRNEPSTEMQKKCMELAAQYVEDMMAW